MKRHWKGILALFSATAALFGAAIVTHSLYLAILALMLGLVLTFVFGTAWMRPRGTNEHHAATDRFVNDRRP